MKIACIVVVICCILPIAKLSIGNMRKNVTSSVNNLYGDGWGDILDEVWSETVDESKYDAMNVSLFDYNDKSSLGVWVTVIAVLLLFCASNII